MFQNGTATLIVRDITENSRIVIYNIMEITLNNQPETIGDGEEEITISQLLAKKEINPNGTAIAVNDHLICHDCWDSHKLQDGDRIVMISAAFGG